MVPCYNTPKSDEGVINEHVQTLMVIHSFETLETKTSSINETGSLLLRYFHTSDAHVIFLHISALQSSSQFTLEPNVGHI